MIDYSAFKFSKGRPKIATKILRDRAENTAEKAAYAKVDLRDGRRCTFPKCKRAMRHHHHIVYRSKLGPDVPANITSVCVVHHSWIHGGLIRVSGRAPRVIWSVTASGLEIGIKIPQAA